MAPPKRKAGGRVTPKGTKPGDLPSAPAPPATGSSASRGPRRAQAPSSRYTPPTPRSVKQSPPWVPVLMFGLLLLGAIMIVLNYLELLPAAASNWYLLGGLGLILSGIFVATQYR
jgi:Cell division protein CrgA